MDARQSRKPIFVDNPDYFKQQTGIVTLQYPHQHLPLPDNGRYQLHNEMDDCIVCDKCAKVCPVDCIEIEPIKATGIAGYASDGSAIRLFAAKFDIDMAKCMFCGLCTTVCPTECLTMTSEYDFSTFDVTNHNFEFGNLTPAQSKEKRELYEQFVAEKEAVKKLAVSSKQLAVSSEALAVSGEVPKLKPSFKPSFKPKVIDNQEITGDKIEEEVIPETPKPKLAFKPSFKPKVVENQEIIEKIEEETAEIPKLKPVFKPSFKPKVVVNKEIVEEKVEEEKVEEISKPKPVENKEVKGDKIGEEIIPETPKPKPVYKPNFKPKVIENKEVIEEEVIAEIPKPKATFKPSFKPKPKAEDNNNSTIGTPIIPKPNN